MVEGRHKPAKRQKTCIAYMHSGQQLCRKTYNFLHSVGKHRVPAIKKSYLNNGLCPRTHGNSKVTQPGKVHTELFRTECHSVACRIPGYKRDDIKLLPSSKSNKVSKTYSYKWSPSDQHFKQAVYVQILH